MLIKFNLKLFSNVLILFLIIVLPSYASDHSLVAQSNQQVNQAREAEAINAIGTILRSQTAYHLEKQGWFSRTIRDLEKNNGSTFFPPLPLSYYNVEIVKADRHQAIVIGTARRNGICSFAGLIQYNPNRTYKSIICRTNSPSYSISLPIDAETCGSGSSLLKT
jgi:hypothetical protein